MRNYHNPFIPNLFVQKLQKMNFFSFLAILFFTTSIVAQEIPEDQWFWIQSAQEVGKTTNGCWDVPGYPKTIKEGEKQNVTVYTIDNGSDRLYKFEQIDENEYKILPKLGGDDFCVQIEPASKKNSINLLITDTDEEETLENFVFTHKGNGVWKIHSLDGRVVCLAGKSSANKTNIQLTNEQAGAWTEWALIDPNTKRRFIPDTESEDNDTTDNASLEGVVKSRDLLPELTNIKVDKLTGPEAKKVVTSLDQTYQEVYKFESRLAKLNANIEKVKKILDKTTVVSSKLNALNAKITRTYDALLVFTKIPVVGPAATTLRTTIGLSKGKIDLVNAKVQKLEKPVILPATDGFGKISDISNAFDEKVVSLASKLSSIKSQYSTASSCAAGTNDMALIGTFEKKSSGVNQNLTDVNTELINMNKEISKLETMTESIAKIGAPIKTAEKGIKASEKVFNKTDKVAKQIHKVLNKRFKKKILGKKINVSVKDVVSGGKIGDAFEKHAKNWASKLLKPVLKGLNVKIPDIPGADKVVDELDKIKSSMNQFTDLNNTISTYSAKTESIQSGLDTQLKECTTGLPCN